MPKSANLTPALKRAGSDFIRRQPPQRRFKTDDLALGFASEVGAHSALDLFVLADRCIQQALADGALAEGPPDEFYRPLLVRELLLGASAPELDQPIKVTVESRVPTKWALVDLETGEIYRGALNDEEVGGATWKRADEEGLRLLKEALNQQGICDAVSQRTALRPSA